ncbi:MAG: NADH-quinone oxidoreductase subunit C [Blastopirellula sp.]|nr:MAG: NADH-quinone oxidoreductase subunit C [Blastopirellula sp.]
MSGEQLIDILKKAFGDKITGQNLEAIDPWIEVSPDGLVEVCKFLRDGDTKLNFLNSICVVDYLETDEKKAKKVTWEPHLEVVYHLSSISSKLTLVLKVMLPRWKDDEPGNIPEIPSVFPVWSTADWHEREVYDLSGVRFTGHPNMRRILCPEDWVGYPLRKDYEMPLEYHGVRGR